MPSKNKPSKGYSSAGGRGSEWEDLGGKGPELEERPGPEVAADLGTLLQAAVSGLFSGTAINLHQ